MWVLLVKLIQAPSCRYSTVFLRHHPAVKEALPYQSLTFQLSRPGFRRTPSSLFSVDAMSLEPPTYLNSLQNNIRARPIPWDGAVRAGNITDEHLRKIKAVDKVRKQERKQAVEADLNGYTTLLAGNSPGVRSVLESASRRTDIVQYILVLAADLINGISLDRKFLFSHR